MLTREEETYVKAQIQREDATNAVINSGAKNKIVVAGPGTGKTHLFKQILNPGSSNIVLTFINSLVDELSLDLMGVAKVSTLHGFARSALSQATGHDVDVHPAIPKVVRRDGVAVGRADRLYERLFHELTIKTDDLEFYRNRKNYYECYGFSDIVFAAIRYWDEKPEKIPNFDLVIVDEFQDFNFLEVSFIETLSRKTELLVAGDDGELSP